MKRIIFRFRKSKSAAHCDATVADTCPQDGPGFDIAPIVGLSLPRNFTKHILVREFECHK
jgi:hypothetical protein